MRKFVILSIAVVLGGAALLIPAGAQGATDGQTYSASVSSIDVVCEAGDSTGTATYTVSVDSGTSKTQSGNEIRVYRGSALVATLTDIPDSETVVEQNFPCPQDSGTASFTFQPYKSTGGGQGTKGDAVNVSATTERSDPSS